MNPRDVDYLEETVQLSGEELDALLLEHEQRQSDTVEVRVKKP
jgi:hypothetical protein